MTKFSGTIADMSEVETLRGSTMAFVEMTTDAGETLELVAFPERYGELADTISNAHASGAEVIAEAYEADNDNHWIVDSLKLASEEEE